MIKIENDGIWISRDELEDKLYLMTKEVDHAYQIGDPSRSYLKGRVSVFKDFLNFLNLFNDELRENL